MSSYKEVELYQPFCTPRDTEKQILILKGILAGIALDGVVSQSEISELQNWCTVNELLNAKEPYKSIIETVQLSIEDGLVSEDEIEDIYWACDNVIKGIYDGVTNAIQELNGRLHGILADGIINDCEIKELQNWIYDNDYLKSTYPYDEIEAIILSILADGVVSEEERKVLKAFFGQFIDATTSVNVHSTELIQLAKKYSVHGVCAVDPEIIFKGKIFCFTGASSRFKRNDIANMIEENGGKYIDKISKNTNYLIFGDNGSPCWAYTCYGRKIEAVMQNRKDGINTVIVHECDFWDSIQNYQSKA